MYVIEGWYSVSPEQSTIFEIEHILTLTPEDIVFYFNLKVLRNTDDNEEITPNLGNHHRCFSVEKKLYTLY